MEQTPDGFSTSNKMRWVVVVLICVLTLLSSLYLGRLLIAELPTPAQETPVTTSVQPA